LWASGGREYGEEPCGAPFLLLMASRGDGARSCDWVNVKAVGLCYMPHRSGRWSCCAGDF
jgi:hypothetical protein